MQVGPSCVMVRGESLRRLNITRDGDPPLISDYMGIVLRDLTRGSAVVLYEVGYSRPPVLQDETPVRGQAKGKPSQRERRGTGLLQCSTTKLLITSATTRFDGYC